MPVTDNIFNFHFAEVDGIHDPSKYYIKDYITVPLILGTDNIATGPNPVQLPIYERYWQSLYAGCQDISDYLTFCPVGDSSWDRLWENQYYNPTFPWSRSVFNQTYVIRKAVLLNRLRSTEVGYYTHNIQGMANYASTDPQSVTGGSELTSEEWAFVYGASGLTVEVSGVTSNWNGEDGTGVGEGPRRGFARSYGNEITPTVENEFLKTSAYEYEFPIAGDKYFYIENDNENYMYSSPVSADIGGCISRTIRDDKYKSPAGMSRGRILDAEYVQTELTDQQKEDLYSRKINFISREDDDQYYLFGDKTRASDTSTFSRINVSLLFIQLKKLIKPAIRSVLFEQNDSTTRTRISNEINRLLRKIQGEDGITDFKVVCDETNNTPDIIDSNNLVVDVFVKPKKSINFIKIRFTNTENL